MTLPNMEPRADRLDVLVAIPALGTGGAERSVAAITSAWARAGRAVGVVTWSSSATDFYTLDPAVERHALNWPPTRTATQHVRATAAMTKHLRSTVRRRRPKVLLSFLPAMRLPALAAAQLCRVPLVVCERSNPMLRHESSRRRLVGRVAEQRATAHVVQTLALRRQTLDRGVKRVWAIPNFLAPDILTEIDNALSERDRTEGEHRLVAVGRLVAEKGFDVLLRAFAASARARTGWRLDIYGSGPERDRLEQVARDEGVASSVVFCGVTNCPGAVLAGADAFVLSSRYEGFPNVLLEAMAASRPVVSTACDFGPAEIIRRDVDGILVRPNDARELAEGLSAVMSDAPLRERLGAAALDVRRRFSIEAVMPRWDELLDHVMASS